MRDVSDFRFGEVLYDTLTGDGNLERERNRKHIWFHDLSLRPTEDGYVVEKYIYNAYDEDITLTTQSIDYSRISEVT